MPPASMHPYLELTVLLLSCWIQIDAQPSFTIRNITLVMEPSTAVVRDTNVTVRCQAVVSSSGQEALSRVYTIYKDSTVVYTKTIRSSEDLVYPLPHARVSNTGKYMCQVEIEGRKMSSDPQKLTVTGLFPPVLHLNQGVVSEGEEISARCTAKGETGSIIFFFYKDSQEIQEERVTSDYAETTLRFSRPGIHKVHCDYIVLITPSSVRSGTSNNVTVTVKEISISPVLQISPLQKVYEGDQLDISCTFSGSRYTGKDIQVYLSQGRKLLSHGNTEVKYNMTALAKDTEEFECRLEIGTVPKFETKSVKITELFSEPTLSMSAAEVFPGDKIKLSCKSENVASERLQPEEITYTITPSQTPERLSGVFHITALPYEANYTCEAQAKGIVKPSKTLTITPKVIVSQPKISVIGKVILGRPFQILCQSDTGSLPINYTLVKKYDIVNTTTVRQPHQQALFTVTIQKPDEITQYMCEAKNNPRKDGQRGRGLNATVTVPLSDTRLTIVPDEADIEEGVELYLICGAKGSAPVTFTWYRSDSPQPLFTSTVFADSMSFVVKELNSKDSGAYYCEASNLASYARSQLQNIHVRMALWKKGLIATSCLLALAVLVLLCVLRFRASRGESDVAAELSVKPRFPKSDDALAVRVTRDTEVYNAATVRVNRTDSVWSERPPNAASDEESSMGSNEPDVEYSEVVHSRPVDPDRVPLRKGTDTVYSELQNSPCGVADHHESDPVQYAELNGDQPEMNHTYSEMHHHHDLPVPVD